uniref:Uncharacterized protein n=1 Tax=Setaria italica TaxID=4555 RepID=K3YNU9_SETIT
MTDVHMDGKDPIADKLLQLLPLMLAPHPSWKINHCIRYCFGCNAVNLVRSSSVYCINKPLHQASDCNNNKHGEGS